MNLETFNRKAGEKNDENNDNKAPGKIHRQSKENDSTQKVSGTFLAGFGVRVHILDDENAWQRARKSSVKLRCRRLQDNAEIMVPANELIFIPGSSEADRPRELFAHKGRWRDPGD